MKKINCVFGFYVVSPNLLFKRTKPNHEGRTIAHPSNLASNLYGG
ncbi:hypothetical protein CKA32_001683 [Geitlerinema sp. FC II]|nr:hypothetical protein CKA32_001683 [Geitlerinema sp. FC II]